MAGGATRRDAGMVHCPGGKTSRGGGAGVTCFASGRGHNMGRRLAHHYSGNRCTHISPGMARRASGGNPGMAHRRVGVCKTARIGIGGRVARFAGGRGCYMVRRFT